MSEQKTIFEGLYQIDWNSLQHVDGQATGVPNALIDLLSNEEMTLKWARRILFDEEKAQWGVFTEAYHYIVPFVCELLPFESVKERERLLFNLSLILNGAQLPFRSTDQSKDYVFIYSTVEAYLPLILTLLHHSDESMRCGAADLLGEMDGNIEDVVPELVARFEIETDHYAQDHILAALGQLFSHHIPRSLSLRNEYASFFRSVVESDRSEDIRYRGAWAGLMAARSMIGSRYIKEDEISPQTAALLLDNFWCEYDKYGIEHRSFYYNEKRLLNIMLLPDAMSLLWEMLHNPRLHVDDQKIILRALFHVKFQPRGSSLYPKLGPPFYKQRDKTNSIYNDIGVEKKKLKGDSLLKNIVEDDSLWHDHPTNVFSYFLGLPDSRDELRAFLESDKD